MASQIMMSAVIHGPKKMENLCVTKGIEKQRVHPQSKKPLEIYQYQYKHQAGICYFYKNDETNATLQEKLMFKLSGLAIVGNEEGDNVVNFKVGPGQTKMIELKAISGQWKIGCQMAYGIM